MLELLLLKHWNHEDSPVVCPNDGRGRPVVLEDEVGGDFLVGEEKSELARVVEGLEDLRVEVDQRVRDVWLTLLGLRAKQSQVTDVHRHF